MIPAAMTDEEVAALESRCAARLRDLDAKGIVYTDPAVHYLQSLLEIHLTAEELRAARVAHFCWLEARLDEAEAQIRRAILNVPITNGRGAS